MVYILISGKIGSGKTTFGLIAKELYKDKVKVQHFADNPKELFCDKYNYDLKKLNTDRTYKESVRNELINYSESEKKIHGKNIWAKLLVNDNSNENSNIIIVPDLRFYEELTYFIDNKIEFKTIRINRNTDTNSTNLTETQFDTYNKFDYIINNNGTIDNLRKNVKYIISNIINNE